jgi:hypothetical protein
MDAVLEPISPELVLVCPELREPALAVLPDFTSYLAPARIRPIGAPARVPLLRLVGGAFADLAGALTPALTLMLAVVLMTGVLTFIADAVASR